MKKIVYFLLSGSLVLTFSCRKDFLDRLPLDQITDENYWASADQLKLAANGCYAYIKGKNTVDMENLGDNTVWPTVTDYQRIASGNYGNDNGGVNAEWTSGYDGIRRCNHFLENYMKAPVTPALRERYAGEVRFIRAYLYNYLVMFFGDVQLITKTLTPSDPEVFGTRQPKAQVVDFILSELDSAAAKLPATYTAADFGRITKGAALALKARVALYQQKYDIAEKAAKDVIDLNVYSLYKAAGTSSYYELFTYKGRASTNATNKESILVRAHVAEISMHNLSREIQVPDQESRWNPTKSLVDAYLCTDGKPITKSAVYTETNYNDIFKNRDPRMVQTVLAPGYAWRGQDDGDADNLPNATYNLPKFTSDKKGSVTVTGYYFTKYCEPSTVGAVSKDANDIILLRYAEVLLTYAEARLERGSLTQADIDLTINQLRSRVGMLPMKLTELSDWGMNPRDEVRRERRIELALEGQRYFDIIRWKQGSLLAEDVKGVKKAFAPVPSEVANRPVDANGYIIFNTNRTFSDQKHYLWPIPLVQLERNPNLGNNPGWQ
ncbi:MAG: RagB/SusD family nutrient uptake outer membrane protein [Chitinophagaceae bacterium]